MWWEYSYYVVYWFSFFERASLLHEKRYHLSSAWYLNLLHIPSLGSNGQALFWGTETSGWEHPPLCLPQPILIIRAHPSFGTRVETPEGVVIRESEDCGSTPLMWAQEILEEFSHQGSTTAKRLMKRPSFPLATVALSYEYGRTIPPHQHCFPRMSASQVDDVYIAIHSCGFVLLNGQWQLVGAKPSSRYTWNHWKLEPEKAVWPKPPQGTRVDQGGYQGDLLGMDHRELASPWSFPVYQEAISCIQEHLHRGDIYQANLTIPFRGKTTLRGYELFARGIALGGERYAAHLCTATGEHISFSPELLLRRWGRQVCTKPIKGTRPVQHESLPWGEKDLAEHLMIVDLERNDLGRLCHYGSVRVDPLMETNRHHGIEHLESTVHGTLRREESLKNLLRAIYPGGSVTGAPKRRALEILSQLETHPRGIYCGAIGWLDHYGDVELNLPIRTATLYSGGDLHLAAGGGIVADSVAEEEWRELHHKLGFFAGLLGLDWQLPNVG